MIIELFLDFYEEASFTKSQYGKPMLVDSNGYTYSKHNSLNQTIYWRCIYFMKHRGGCPARAQTEGFYIKSKSHSHIHPPKEPVVKKLHGNSKAARALKQSENK